MVPQTSTEEQINELEARLESTQAELSDLATMGAVITSIQQIDAILSVVMDMAIRLANGEVGLIMLEDEDELALKISWGVSEQFARSLMYRDDMDLPTYCFTRGETIILSELGLVDTEGLSIDSIICLPIKTAEKRFGVMTIINKAGGGHFDENDKRSLELLLNFVAVAIDNSKLMETRLQQQKNQQEMAIARQIQETILPQDIDNVPGIEIGAVYYPARDVGGDFYDIHRLGESRFVVVLGDVSNKGVPAALVMSAASGIINTILTMEPDIPMNELAQKLNDLLSDQIIKDREMFVTLFFSRFDLEKKELTFCNAGHIPGLYWDDQNKTICELADGGPIVGQFPGVPFKLGTRSLGAGDRLFLFTDGLTEAADNEGNLFGRERAEQVFSVEIGLPPKEFCSRVKEWVDRFAEGAAEETIDDFTIMQVKVE